MTDLRALAIADRLSGELVGALAALERALPTVVLPTIGAAEARSSAGAEPPDLLVLLQSRGGQFLERELLQLRSWMPLARAVAVLGSWCEGELRSGQPLAGVRRVAWHAWPLRLEREIAAWRSGGGTWSLPVTAAEEELFLQADASAGLRSTASRAQAVAIRSAHPPWGACLADALGRRGFSAVSLRPGQLRPSDAFLALVDDVPLPTGLPELRARYRTWLPQPIIALADFPRRLDQRLVREAGAAALLGKPLDLDELVLLLEQLLPASAR
ncbi:MAG TPA: hypothetical protein VHY20_14205 [Pirellulales bacterium]|jgi:hypothetical protein|nr:hypothetical protein [Pirellulales bacterium]